MSSLWWRLVTVLMMFGARALRSTCWSEPKVVGGVLTDSISTLIDSRVRFQPLAPHSFLIAM